jgi:hypothetical protein
MKRARFLVLAMGIGWLLAGCGDDAGTTPDAASATNPDVGTAADLQAGPNLDSGPAMDAMALLGPVDTGTLGTTLAPPTGLSVAPGDTPGTAKVIFSPPASPMAGMALSYVVTASPGALAASGTQSPIVLAGLSPRGAYTFSIIATDGMMTSAPASTGLVSIYDVVETFREPMTQPNDTLFTGSFAFDATNKTVWNLTGSLTESMTKVNGVYGGPMTTVTLANQLSATPVLLDGASGLLVTTFALTTVDTFTGGGFAPGGSQYYGLLEGTPNNHNAYAMIFVNATDPTATPSQVQIDKLAYADCTAGGMMMNSCMTGTAVAGYGVKGTMGAYPLSQVITKR